jgi:prolipoprotein diacylglyceryltransferase
MSEIGVTFRRSPGRTVYNKASVIWHFLLEALAYSVAFRLYLRERKRCGDFLNDSTRWSIVAAAIGGAVFGSKLLYWFEDPQRTWQQWNSLQYLMGGKTVVGAILGGTLAVEWIKRRLGIVRRTGDLFAVPLAVGIAIGRIGCFLAGPGDDTHGIATSLPWGMDLGDGVHRHPVQLYECAAMALLAVLLSRMRVEEGGRFRAFLLAYFGWRLLVDFLKPGVAFGGLTILQWCCLEAVIWYAPDGFRLLAGRVLPRRAEANG